MSVLKNEQIGYNIINNNGNKNEIVLRVFLTSSRSFKNKIATNESVHEILKDFILLTSMPKFIWVAEISNRDLYSRKKAFGLIIVDATGNASLLYETILILMYPDKIIKFNSKEHKFDFINNDFGVFDIYKNNLKALGQIGRQNKNLIYYITKYQKRRSSSEGQNKRFNVFFGKGK